MNDLVGYMGIPEIYSKVGDFTEKNSILRISSNFEDDFKETHVFYEVVHGDQYCLE